MSCFAGRMTNDEKRSSGLANEAAYATTVAISRVQAPASRSLCRNYPQSRFQRGVARAPADGRTRPRWRALFHVVAGFVERDRFGVDCASSGVSARHARARPGPALRGRRPSATAHLVEHGAQVKRPKAGVGRHIGQDLGGYSPPSVARRSIRRCGITCISPKRRPDDTASAQKRGLLPDQAKHQRVGPERHLEWRPCLISSRASGSAG